MKSTGTTIQVGSDDRGQTTQDFAVGISVFLLTIGFVFGFLPTLLSPFGTSVGDDITAKSDRVAGTMVHDLTVEGQPRTLDADDLEAFITSNATEEKLREYFGLRASADINITVMNVHDGGGRDVLSISGTPMRAGDRYRSPTPAASTTRVVRVSGGACDVQCVLIVRVW